MTLVRALEPFQFVTQVNQVHLTGLRAKNLEELLARLKEVPTSVIYHHTHHFLKQHQFLSPEPPNDFAYWVTNVLQEDRLGEKLAAIDTVQFRSIRALGDKIISVIEKYLKERGSTRTAPEGEAFHFMKSIGFILPTPYVASDLHEFEACLRKISPQSLYHHIFEARVRLENENNDFSNWLVHQLQENELARLISRLDPYTQTLEGLRNKILMFIGDRLKILAKETSHAAR